jgi:hypothetical protein
VRPGRVRVSGGVGGRALRAAVVFAALGVWTATPVRAQVQWRDLVLTLGGSVERYSGNFSAVTVPIVDSTDHATAAVGEVGIRGTLALIERDRRRLVLSLDGGMRQAAATGFEVRDYAPREWVGSGSLQFSQALGGFGQLTARAGVRTRSIDDRPPMPLFLQPGYTTVNGGLGFILRSVDGVTIDAELQLESADYRAFALVPQLDLLDRRGAGFEVGTRWGSDPSSIRFFGGVRWSEYEHQGSFDPSDPFRRDRTVSAGLDWTHFGRVFAQFGLEGTVNRSNSKRPEYDAISMSALFTAPLPGRFTLNAYALLTDKSYVTETDFARLVPGEEADNASIAYVQLGRPVAINLDAAVRLGWTRAETDIGNAYYQRFGMSMQLNYRPNGH